MFSRRTFHDASEQEAALPGWQQRYTHLSSGRFEGEVALLRLGGVTVMREQMNVSTEQRYLPPANNLVLFSHAATSGGFYVHGAHYPGRSIGFEYSQDEGLIVTSPQADMMMLVVDAAPFAANLRRSIGVFGPQSGQRARDLFTWLGTLLHMYARAEPAQPALAMPDEARALLPDLIEDRLTLLLDGVGGQPAGMAREEPRLYGRCVEWLQAHPNAPVTVSELAAALDVPHERLRAACLYATGHKLDAILMLHRLNGARRALLAARETRRKVSDVALDWGFFHWGRFAVRYHALFGEPPSQTIRAA